jgi:hypothetical protein
LWGKKIDCNEKKNGHQLLIKLSVILQPFQRQKNIVDFMLSSDHSKMAFLTKGDPQREEKKLC